MPENEAQTKTIEVHNNTRAKQKEFPVAKAETIYQQNK